jgi:ArsR family transcriptional regulator, virulence genes transcriptional regulator
MKDYKLQAEVCKALSHPVRLQVLDLVSKRERSVDELAKLVGVGQPNLSMHLAALRHRRLVTARRDGMNVYYKTSHAKIADACSLIQEVVGDLLERDRRTVSAVMEVTH